MHALDPSRFDSARPSCFYLDDEEFQQLADVELVVQGVALPVHSQVSWKPLSLLAELRAVWRCCCPMVLVLLGLIITSALCTGR